MNDRAGPLIIIGGHEDKTGDRAILKRVARHVHGGRLVIATVASHQPEGYFNPYGRAFADLGVTDLVELSVRERRILSVPCWPARQGYSSPAATSCASQPDR